MFMDRYLKRSECLNIHVRRQDEKFKLIKESKSKALQEVSVIVVYNIYLSSELRAEYK
jgi:hypothetical protein